MLLVPWNYNEAAEEVRRRLAAGESLPDIVKWLGQSGAKAGEAVALLQQNAGLTRERAEHEVATHPDWKPLVDLIGGIGGETEE